MITLDITVTNTNFTSLDIADNTVGDNNSGDYTVTSASVDVYVRNSSTPINIDLILYYNAATTLPVTYSITPSDLNQSDIFTDGTYQLIFHIERDNDGTPETGNLTNYQLMYSSALGCLQSKIGDLPMKDCGCDGVKSKDVDYLFTLYMQLQSAIFSHECGKYLKAQNKIDTVNKLCNDCGCGCN